MTVDPSAPDDHQSVIDPSFTVVRRGFDQSEVRRALMGLAGDLRAARERELLLERQLAEAERRAEAVDPLDPAHLTKLLGDEVARILDAARAAAAQIRVRADEAATRLFEETKAEAAADAAAVLERAELEAREILRLAQERSGGSVGSEDARADADAEADAVDGPPRPTQQRSGRSGVDPDRTAGLFASLREQQAAPPAPGTVRKRRSTTSSTVEPPVARSVDTEPTTVPAPQSPTVTPIVPIADDAPVPEVPRTSASVGVDAALAQELSRTVKRALTDDCNALLAAFTGPRGRGRSIAAPLDPSLGPSVGYLVERLMVTLGDRSPSMEQSAILEVAGAIAEAVVVPLRARIDEILVGCATEPDGIPEQVRACFRQTRGELVDPVVRSVLAAMSD